MAFIPKGREIPQSSNNYLKFEDGDNKIRILDEAILGYKFQTLDDVWHKTHKEPKIPIGQFKVDQFGSTVKFFVAIPVWCYKDKDIKLMELTQVSIIRAIEGYDKDPDWGNVQKYDLNIVRGKEGGKTTYSVKPSPNKNEISQEIKDIYESKKNELKVKFDDEEEVPLPQEEPEGEQKGEPKKEEIEIRDLPF